MEKGKFIRLLLTCEHKKLPGGDPVPAQTLGRAVLVLLRLSAFPFEAAAKPAWLRDPWAVCLCYLLFQCSKNTFRASLEFQRVLSRIHRQRCLLLLLRTRCVSWVCTGRGLLRAGTHMCVRVPVCVRGLCRFKELLMR